METAKNKNAVYILIFIAVIILPTVYYLLSMVGAINEYNYYAESFYKDYLNEFYNIVLRQYKFQMCQITVNYIFTVILLNILCDFIFKKPYLRARAIFLIIVTLAVGSNLFSYRFFESIGAIKIFEAFNVYQLIFIFNIIFIVTLFLAFLGFKLYLFKKNRAQKQAIINDKQL